MNTSRIPHWFKLQWANCLLKVRYAGIFYTSSVEKRGRRDHWIFCYIFKGTLLHRSFNRYVIGRTGQSVILLPTRHSEHGSYDNLPLEVCEIGFDVKVFLNSVNPLTRLGLPVAVTLSKQAKAWCEQLIKCYYQWKPVDDIAELQARCWLDLLLLDYLEQGFSTGTFTLNLRPVPLWIQAMADLLARKCPNLELRPRKLYKLSGYSRAYVNAEFKKYFGESPRQYLHRKRIELAMGKLSSNPEMSIGEIAAVCGYSSQSLFNSHFKRLTGQTPRQFRYRHFYKQKL